MTLTSHTKLAESSLNPAGIATNIQAKCKTKSKKTRAIFCA